MAVPHEITLLAMTKDDDGRFSVVDIVDTSYRHAGRFVRAWLRDPQVTRIGTRRADAPVGFEHVHWRDK